MSDLYMIALFWLATAAVCSLVARVKGLSPVLWFFRGLAGGLFSLGYLLLTPGD